MFKVNWRPGTGCGKRKLKAIAVFVALLCGGLSARSAWAAVSVDNDGADGKQAVILIRSTISRGDFDAFAVAADRIRAVASDRLNDVPHITVELESPGGDLVEAIKIGRLIHERYMMTLVRPGHQCVSACVLVMIAGAVHSPADGATIGLHRPLLLHYAHETRREAYAKFDSWMDYLREYFRTLGVSNAAYDLMMSTRSNRMRYFSTAELDDLRLRGVDPAWEQLYSAKWAAGAPRAEPRQALAPELPPIAEFEKDRNLFVMPTEAELAASPISSTLPHYTQPNFKWQSLDDDPPSTAVARSFDPTALLRALAQILANHFRAVGILVLIVAIEVLRNRSLTGADNPEQWRRAPWSP